MQTSTGRVINTAAILVEATEEAFNQLTAENTDTPEVAKALLDAGLTALRAIRDNPAILTNDPRVLQAMKEITFAITAAAGFTRAIYTQGTTVPDKSALN